uniref:MARVEL domain-containing protein n=1 Tax=Ditylenchus dipsaci TaxID=166011 RepID=A0A915DXZ1_9BILA
MASINTNYLSTNRGIIKILQIVLGFVISSVLYGNWWYGTHTRYGDGRISFCSSLNSICVIINIVLLILHLLEVEIFKLERVYSIVATVLFLVASVMIVWVTIEFNLRGTTLIATVLIVAQFLLFLWDVKIIQGEASN